MKAPKGTFRRGLLHDCGNFAEGSFTALVSSEQRAMWTALSPAVDNLKLPERGGGEMRTLASSRRSTINKIARIMVTFKLLHPFKGSFCDVSWAIQNSSWRIVYQSKCLHSHWGVKKWGGTIYQNFAHIHSNSSFCTQPNVLSDFSKGEFKHSRVHNRIVPLLASPPSLQCGALPFHLQLECVLTGGQRSLYWQPSAPSSDTAG